MSDFMKANDSKRNDHLSGSKNDSNIPCVEANFGEKIEYLKDGSKVKYDAVSARDLFDVLQFQSGRSTACNVMNRLLPKKRSKSLGHETINSLILRRDNVREITKEELVEQICSSPRRPKRSPNKVAKNNESFGKSRSSSRSSSRKPRKKPKEDDFYVFPDSDKLPHENAKPTAKITLENNMEAAIKRERDSDGDGNKIDGYDLIEYKKPPRRPYDDSIEVMRNSDTTTEIGNVSDSIDKCESPNHQTVNKLQTTLSLEHLDDHMNEILDPAKHPEDVTKFTLMKPSKNYKKEVIQNEMDWNLNLKKSEKDDSIKNEVSQSSIDVNKELVKSKTFIKLRKPLSLEYLDNIPDLGLSHKLDDSTLNIPLDNAEEETVQSENSSYNDGKIYEFFEIKNSPPKANDDTIEVMRDSDTTIQIGRLLDSFDKCESSNHPTVNEPLSLEHLDDHMNEIQDPAKHPYNDNEFTLMKPSKNYKKEVIQNEKDWNLNSIESDNGDSMKNKVSQSSTDVKKEPVKSKTPINLRKPLSVNYLDNISDLGLSHKLDDSTLNIPLDNTEEDKDQSENCSYNDGKKYEFFEIKNSPRRPKGVLCKNTKNLNINEKPKSPKPKKAKQQTNRKQKVDEILDTTKLQYETGERGMDGVDKKCGTNDSLAVKNLSRKSKDVTCKAKNNKDLVVQKSEQNGSPNALLSRQDVWLATAILKNFPNLDECVLPSQEFLNRMNEKFHRWGLPSMDENLVKEMRKHSSLLINYAKELRIKFEQQQVKNKKYRKKRSEQEHGALVCYLGSGSNLSPPSNSPSIYVVGVICLTIFIAMALLYIAIFFLYAPKVPTWWERILIMLKKIIFELLLGYFFG